MMINLFNRYKFLDRVLKQLHKCFLYISIFVCLLQHLSVDATLELFLTPNIIPKKRAKMSVWHQSFLEKTF